MDGKVIKIIAVVFFLFHLCVGAFILYNIFSPEIAYEQSTIEREIEEKYEEEIPKQNMMVISKIGVEMKIGEPEHFLDFGGWIQKLNQENNPFVISAHRFGWNTFSLDQKRKQTLYHVDKLSEEDEIIVFWEGEKLTYRVKQITTATNNPSIKDSELLIYTCKFWNSAERVFVLAKKIDNKIKVIYHIPYRGINSYLNKLV